MNDFIHRSMSYPGIFLLMLLENLFPPLPSELIMSLAGYRAATGELNFWAAVLVGSLGSLAGQLPLYYLGRIVGKEALKRWADRHGAWLTLTGRDIDRADEWFHAHGGHAVLLGRLLPGVRTVISLPAGFAKLAPWKFVAFSTVGTTGWSLVPAYFGKVLGENYQQVGRYVGLATWVFLASMVVGFSAFVVRRRKWRGHDTPGPAP